MVVHSLLYFLLRVSAAIFVVAFACAATAATAALVPRTQEYLYLSNYQGHGIDANPPSTGILIFHVDESLSLIHI